MLPRFAPEAKRFIDGILKIRYGPALCPPTTDRDDGHLIFGPNPAIGLILLPIMIYHPLQLLAGGMLAQRWSDTEAAGGAPS